VFPGYTHQCKLLKPDLEFLSLGHDVGLNVELGEKYEEEDGVGTDEVGELPGEVAVVVEHLKDKLH